jgi:hypothetical protein
MRAAEEIRVWLACNIQRREVKGQEGRRHEFINGLIAVGRFYQENSEAYYDGMEMTLCMYVDGKGAKRALAVTAKAFGRCEKSFDEKHIAVSMRFSEKVRIEIVAPRGDVCQRMVLGTRVEPGIILPATREIYLPEAAVEVFGWKCDPLLAP